MCRRLCDHGCQYYSIGTVVEQQMNEMREVVFAYTKTMVKMGLRTYVIWNEIFAFLKNGDFSIDNNLA